MLPVELITQIFKYAGMETRTDTRFILDEDFQPLPFDAWEKSFNEWPIIDKRLQCFSYDYHHMPRHLLLVGFQFTNIYADIVKRFFRTQENGITNQPTALTIYENLHHHKALEVSVITNFRGLRSVKAIDHIWCQADPDGWSTTKHTTAIGAIATMTLQLGAAHRATPYHNTAFGFDTTIMEAIKTQQYHYVDAGFLCYPDGCDIADFSRGLGPANLRRYLSYASLRLRIHPALCLQLQVPPLTKFRSGFVIALTRDLNRLGTNPYGIKVKVEIIVDWGYTELWHVWFAKTGCNGVQYLVFPSMVHTQWVPEG